MNDLRWPGLSAEQLTISSTVEEFLAEHSDEAAVRRLMVTERGFDDKVWAGLAGLGVPAMMIPEEHGGLGLSAVELALVMMAAGASLLCAPLLSSAVLATTLIARAADGDAKRHLLPALAAGSRRATVALGHAEPVGVGVVPAVRAATGSTGWRLDGECRFVLDGHTADDIVVAARAGDSPGLFVVHAGAPGLTRTAMRTLDLTRKQAALTFDATPARPLSIGASVPPAVEFALDVARVMLAAEQVGGAVRCLRMAVDYAKVRTQFDRIIGSFQAVKHTCANMLVTIEGARAAMIDGVRVLAAGAGRDVAGAEPRQLAAAASLAKVACSDGYFSVASDALHVHGGIGFTWEHPAHLYFRRAKSGQLMLGSPGRHLDRLLELAGLARRAPAAVEEEAA